MTDGITSKDFSEIRWRGNWIWVEAPAPSHPFGELDPYRTAPRPEEHALFRKTFTLKRTPKRAPARITADSRYLLFVNGQEAWRGPVRSQPRRLHYDLLDLAPYLKPGENVIAVYVKYYGRANSYWLPATHNMTLGKSGVMVFEADLGESGWLVSDATWKALKCDAWSELQATTEEGPGGGVPVELFDARHFPTGWQTAGFDDQAWGNAQLIPAMHIGGYARTTPPTDPYGPLYPRPIAKLGGETCLPVAFQIEVLDGGLDLTAGSPARRVLTSMSAPVNHTAKATGFPLQVSVPQGGAVRLLLDMGRIVAGFPQFEVAAPAGAVFDFAYAEEPFGGRAIQFGGLSAGTRYVARGTDDRFQVFDANGLRYIYVLVHDCHGPVTLKHCSVREDVYPWQPGAQFHCSDEELNRIFQSGIRTVQLNSRDSFTDCPTREQRAWVGDSVVHQMVHLATNTDWRLAWHYLTLSDSPRSDGILPMSVAGEIEAAGGVTIPDWALHWVHGVYNLYRFTGDWGRVKSFMPSVERVLRWYTPYLTSTGQLKDLVEWNLVDWAAVSNEDTTAIITALWARGLGEFAEMAAWLEEKSSQRWAEGLHARVKAGFEVFWDESRGSYVDHIKDGVRRPEMSQLGGALAILAELAPQERWERIILTITDPHKLVEAAWMGGEFSSEKMQKQMRGIYEPDWDVERQIVRVQPFMNYVVHDAVAKAGLADLLPGLCRRWSMFLTGGYDTIGENWNWGTHVHGWSCTPTKDMIFYTLGVTPAEPGYTTARIAPRLGDLQWAEGKVPTPHGLISVHAEPGKVSVDSPVPVIVDLPGMTPQSLPAGVHEVRS